ncbi:hypothetical protein FHS29_004619 [Saccharothrix tamanrassetensis]|uniref:Uncharacterized protein n=1 Tax=Saccharothrix tamanrassetensis TaxID=1051531 RepID=A0A841CKG4_9PSEU|nr:hypothetical protein [Saccharothrix tamanrassetensis]MBB5958011.1 hypothetical protein [Saccharothrix tamanrassetensis]
MRALAWVFLLAGIAGTTAYVVRGLTSDHDTPWLNGLLSVPLVTVIVVPVMFSIARLTKGVSLSGGVHRTFRGAPLGIGRVTGVARTSLSVSDQPLMEIELEVDTPEGHTFRGRTRQVVDITELGAVRIGTTLPVRYLPDGRVTLATDAAPHEVQAAFDRVQLAKGLITPRQLHIAEHGTDAHAVVLSLVPTGEVRHDRSVVDLTLRVTRPDRTMFDLTRQRALPPSVIPQLQPGAVVRVRYLPHDESEVTVLTRLKP